MLFEYNDENADGVALLAEGVDRNWQVDGTTGRLERSPSSRRAWIEMS